MGAATPMFAKNVNERDALVSARLVEKKLPINVKIVFAYCAAITLPPPSTEAATISTHVKHVSMKEGITVASSVAHAHAAKPSSCFIRFC